MASCNASFHGFITRRSANFFFVYNEFVENRFCDVVAIAVKHLEDLVGVEELLEFAFISFFLLLIPVPFVYLRRC